MGVKEAESPWCSSGTEKSVIHEVLETSKQQNPIQSKEYCTNLEILFGPATAVHLLKAIM